MSASNARCEDVVFEGAIGSDYRTAHLSFTKSILGNGRAVMVRSFHWDYSLFPGSRQSESKFVILMT